MLKGGGGVLGNNNIGRKKCTTIFLWVLNLGQVGGRRKFFQNHPYYDDFLKNGLKSNFLEKIIRDFPLKNEEKILLEIFK